MLSIVVNFNVHAQQSGSVKSLSQNFELKNPFVLCMLQDHKGFIWVGTQNGLIRYDGYQSVEFKENPNVEGGLKGIYVRSIFEDSQKRIWVGTDKGLSLLNQETGTFQNISLESASSSSSSIIVADIDEDIYGNMWLAVRSKGLIKISPQHSGEWQVAYYAHQPNTPNSISSDLTAEILCDKRGFVWASTEVGLDRIHIESDKIENYPLPHISGQSNEPTKASHLRLDNQGNIVVSAIGIGLFKIENPYQDPFQEKYALLLSTKKSLGSSALDVITDFRFVDHNTLVVSSSKDLYYFNLNTTSLEKYRLEFQQGNEKTVETISEIMVDRDGQIWLGTYGDGLFYATSTSGAFQHIGRGPSGTSSLLDGPVRSIATDDAGNVWVAGVDNGTLDKIKYVGDKGWVKMHSLEYDPNSSDGIPSEEFNHLIRSRSGNLWLATYHKDLIEVNTVTHQITTYETPSGDAIDYGTFWSLCEDRNGNIWIGTLFKGVHKLTPRTGAFKTYSSDSLWTSSISNKFVTYLYEDRLGNIWICTGLGLYRYDPESDQMQEFLHDPSDSGSLSNSWVWEILEDRFGYFWVATNFGLNRYNPITGQFQQFYEQDGLPSNLVNGLLEDHSGNIWTSSDAGLARILNDEKATTYFNYENRIRTFSKKNELNGDAFILHAAYQDEKTGHLYFGGNHGVTIIQPDQIHMNTAPPDMLISSSSVSRNSQNSNEVHFDPFIHNKDKFQLNHSDNILSFSFTDLSYDKKGQNEYEYRLTGLSDQWIPLDDDKKMAFINIAPGEFSLSLKGKTPDNIIISETKLLDIYIQPPWWLTWWAYAVYFLGILASTYLFYRFQLSRQLEKQESKRLRTLDNFKSKLYTNITHEFRTPLTVISGMADQIDAHDDEKKLIKRNSNQLLNLVNQMLDLRKLESGEMQTHMRQGDIVRFLRYIIESLHSLANNKDIELHFLCDMEELIMDYDSDKMTRIISNLLSNAIKFTPSGGNIYLHIEHDMKNLPPQMILKLRDTGIGISEDKLSHIFDRFYQVDDSSTRQGEGTGIGLTLVREMVHSLSGSITVTSLLSKGTTFTMSLPITQLSDEFYSDVSLETSAQKINIVPTIIDENLKLGGAGRRQESNSDLRESILITEDNPDVIHYLITCLQGEYSLEIALNGAEGIDKAIDIVPDLIISDVMMPEKDGFELCQTLKSDERTSHVPIILLTAKADYDSRLEGLTRGADAYMAKPFDKKELLVQIQKLIALRKSIQSRYSTLELTETSDPGVKIEDAFVQKFRALVEEHLDDSDFAVVHIARALHISRSQLQRKIKALTGKSCAELQRSIRLHKAKQLLSSTDRNISEISYDVGFQYLSSFSKAFSTEFGVTPTEYRERM